MPTVIDSLVVSLGLDNSKFKKGREENKADLKRTKDEAASAAKDIEASGKKAAEFFAGMKLQALQFFTVIAGGVGLEKFVTQQVTANAATGRLAENLGIATEQLSAWQQILVRSGGTAEDANTTFQNLAQTISDLELGQNPANVGVLQRLHITPADLKDTEGALLKIADGLHAIDDAKVRTNLGQRLGFSTATVNLLSRGSPYLREQLELQRRIGVVTQADADAAIRLQNAWEGLKQSSTAVGRAILTGLTPYIIAAANALDRLATWAKNNPGIIKAAFLGIAAAALVMNVALLPEIAIFAAIAAAIAAISAAIGWVINDFNRFKDGTSLLDWSGMANGLGNVGSAFRDLANAAHEALDKIDPRLWDAIGSSVTRLANGAIAALVNVLNGVAVSIRTIANLTRGQSFEDAATNAANATRADIAQGDRRAPPGAATPARSAPPASGQPPAVPAAPAPARAPSPVRPLIPPRPTGSAEDQTLALIRQREGFQPVAKWDRNAYRAGFGSDTTTDARTGAVRRVTRDTTVTRENAEADLRRRVTNEFIPAAQRAVGAQWAALNAPTQAALASIAYNYGRLPSVVARAARSGDVTQIANAIESLKGDNQGINQARRLAEAAIVRNSGIGAGLPPASAALAAGATANDNRRTSTTETNIGQITVNTQATDAAGIARGIGGAVQAYPFVAQANTGLQ